MPNKAAGQTGQPAIPTDQTSGQGQKPQLKESKEKLSIKQRPTKSSEKLKQEQKKISSKSFDENVERMKKSINK